MPDPDKEKAEQEDLVQGDACCLMSGGCPMVVKHIPVSEAGASAQERATKNVAVVWFNQKSGLVEEKNLPQGILRKMGEKEVKAYWSSSPPMGIAAPTS